VVKAEERSVRMQQKAQPEVMVVDHDEAMRTFLSAFIAECGCQAVVFDDADAAVERYASERPATVILGSVAFNGSDGLGLLAALKKIDRDVPIIVVSSQGRTTTIVQAMKLGASDFISQPFEKSDLQVPLTNALKQHELTREVASLRQQLQSENSQSLIFGDGGRMAEVRELINRVADTDVTVLVRGESGTGKELVSRALYAASRRRDRPFVKVNCAALPTELLESELFGFERGAFTGAVQRKPGRFEFANHGTMFLDEISEMSPPLQAKLLQVLQDGEFSRLGGKNDVHVDVRIIAATNRDLERFVADGHFREDLFFRLNVMSIFVPPLRERRDEIPILADHFGKKYSVQYNKPRAEISRDTMALFMDYDWPGNVRELENLIKRTVILGGEAPIRKEIAQAIAKRRAVRGPAASSNGHAVDATIDPASPAPKVAMDAPGDNGNCSLKDIARTAARQAEREIIERMLQRTRWNRKQAADNLGISYKALLYKIKENGLDKAS
jgi:two-component system response regulator AtoC